MNPFARYNLGVNELKASTYEIVGLVSTGLAKCMEIVGGHFLEYKYMQIPILTRKLQDNIKFAQVVYVRYNGSIIEVLMLCTFLQVILTVCTVVAQENSQRPPQGPS